MRTMMKASTTFVFLHRLWFCSLAERSENGRIAYCFKLGCIGNVRQPGIKGRILSTDGNLSPWRVYQLPLKEEALCGVWERWYRHKLQISKAMPHTDCIPEMLLTSACVGCEDVDFHRIPFYTFTICSNSSRGHL